MTTLDSFLYNLYRVPVTELFSHKKHYAIPRMRIFVSSVFFDEAHLVFEEHDDVKLYVASREALRVLKYMRVPTIIASATLTKRVLGDIKEVIDSEVLVHIKLCSRSEREGDAICVFDEEFLNETTSIEWRISKVREDEVVDRVREFVEQGKRVLVACDTVDDAIRRYRGLASIDSMRDKIALLHGRLTHEDRRRAFEKMKKAGKGFALVATSVVEAGVDISFDVLITDVSRVTSFIQRCGRVCRRVDECRDGRAEVYLVESTACLKDPICNGVIEFVERHQSFVPRIPFDFKNYKGYGDLLELHDMYLSASLGKSPKSRKELHQPSFLQMLSTALFVSSHSINIVLRESDYALVRTGIVEVFVGSEESKRLSEDKRLHLSVDQVNKILNRAPRCIKYFVLLDENGEVLDKAPIEHITETSSGDKRRLVLRKLYEELVKLKRRERRVDVEHYGLLLAEDCYEQGVGLRT
ncbi:MAG: CRISPR-associated helicase Cas3' [Acidilobaceae archaeon]